MTAPRFKHDCEQCEFVARHSYNDEDLDLYYCPGSLTGGSMIARRSDEGSDYSSIAVDVYLSLLQRGQVYSDGHPFPLIFHRAQARIEEKLAERHEAQAGRLLSREDKNVALLADAIVTLVVKYEFADEMTRERALRNILFGETAEFEETVRGIWKILAEYTEE